MSTKLVLLREDQDIHADRPSLVMDVTDRQSILAGQKVLQEKEGKLHILVNKYVYAVSDEGSTRPSCPYLLSHSAGQVGPVSRFFNDMSAPEHASPETLGRALFENESFEAWSQIYSINTFSIFFVTTAFLGLLAKGGEERPGYLSCVINNSSVSAHWKLAQNHVRLFAQHVTTYS